MVNYKVGDVVKRIDRTDDTLATVVKLDGNTALVRPIDPNSKFYADLIQEKGTFALFAHNFVLAYRDINFKTVKEYLGVK